jgi:hypothetical protein
VEVVVGGARQVPEGVVLEFHRAVGGIHDLLEPVVHRPGVLAGAFLGPIAKGMSQRPSVLVALPAALLLLHFRWARCPAEVEDRTGISKRGKRKLAQKEERCMTGSTIEIFNPSF